MKLSRIEDIAPSVEALQYDEERLEALGAVKAGLSPRGHLRIMIGERDLLEGAFSEAHDIKQCEKLEMAVLNLVEEYLVHTISVSKRELVELGIEVDR